MEVIIVGAGASGLTCAITLARKGNIVTVLEKLSDSAKKILSTGNGRCNYWNTDFDNKNFYSKNDQFINSINTVENRKEVMDYFESLGVVPAIKNGYYYPSSMQASSIRDLLLFECNKLGVKIINDSNVVDAKKENNKFIVNTSNKTYFSDYLVIATGSYAYYKDKTNGYDICKSFGHSIIPVLPSLVQLIGNDNFYKDWAGVRSNANVSIYVDDKYIKDEDGEIMLTDYGISGICVFNLSGIANRALYDNKKVNILINFLPDIDNLYELLESRNNTVSNRNIDMFLEGLLNYKLIDIILKRSNIDKNKKYNDLSEEQKNSLINNIQKFNVSIIDSKSFDNAQVCTGGINTEEIDSNTMESKLCKGLYIIGEVVDVDGICGGYNLGFAWLSGIIAGRSVNND